MPQTTPAYDLEDIQRQMDHPSRLYPTGTARDGIRKLGMDLIAAVKVIQALTPAHFYKSMPCTTNPALKPHDVYRTEYEGVEIYIKIQEAAGYFYFSLVSFKEK